jgi:hypothetical protein
MAQFEEALKRLVEDAKFRTAVVADPDSLTKNYSRLAPNEILLLLQVWHATGDPEAARMIWLCHCCCGHTSPKAQQA